MGKNETPEKSEAQAKPGVKAGIIYFFKREIQKTNYFQITF